MVLIVDSEQTFLLEDIPVTIPRHFVMEAMRRKWALWGRTREDFKKRRKGPWTEHVGEAGVGDFHLSRHVCLCVSPIRQMGQEAGGSILISWAVETGWKTFILFPVTVT